MLSFDRVQFIAAREAYRKHDALNTDMSEQIDIFKLINKSKIPLAFQPLKSLSGVFIPSIPEEGIVPGILINENHPRSRQRYTAAHELCHYIRDNEFSFDLKTEVIARAEFNNFNDRERIAEAFAAWFLMPEDLIQHQCNLQNINFNQLEPDKIYQLSLTLGTSYSATVNHLYTLHKINWNIRNQLLKISPKEIKSKIAYKSDTIHWNDVWTVDITRHIIL